MKKITEKEAMLRLSALCAQGERCQWEMMEKMRKWEISDDVQARIMERLIKDRYVDDERFARAFSLDKIRYNKWGRRKVEQALWQKHIDNDIRQRVLDNISDEEYLNVLRPLLKKKTNEIRGTGYEVNQKLIRFAVGRGFTFDIIRQCMEVENEDEYMESID